MQSALLPVGVRARPQEDQIAQNRGRDGGGIGSMAHIAHISHFDPLESFPQCDFEDDVHPFCDWAQALGDGGHWTRENENMHTQGAGSFGGEETDDPPSQQMTESSPGWGVGWCD